MHRFDIVPMAGKKQPDPATGLWNLCRATRKVGGIEAVMGDVVPLNRIQTAVEVVPLYDAGGPHPGLTHANTLEYCAKFQLNHFSPSAFFYNFMFD
jgi:hypothetical protein